jgi:hypothetical protein
LRIIRTTSLPARKTVVPFVARRREEAVTHQRVGVAEVDVVEALRQRHFAGVVGERAVARRVGAAGDVANALGERGVGAGRRHHLGTDAEARDQLRRAGRRLASGHQVVRRGQLEIGIIAGVSSGSPCEGGS